MAVANRTQGGLIAGVHYMIGKYEPATTRQDGHELRYAQYSVRTLMKVYNLVSLSLTTTTESDLRPPTDEKSELEKSRI